MKQLIMAELDYQRTRYLAAVAFASVPMLILLAIDHLSGGVIPFEEPFFLPIIYLFSMGPAMLFILGQGLYKERVENRVRLQITLPLSSLKIALAHQILQNGALAMMVAVWSILAVLAGAKPVAHDMAIWLLMNALILVAIDGTSLAEQVAHSSKGIKIAYKIAVGVAVFIIIASNTLAEVIFNILETLPLDASALINLMKATHLWVVSLTGAISLLSISLLIPILVVVLFTRRMSFLKQ